jgi:hypothetical protein
MLRYTALSDTQGQGRTLVYTAGYLGGQPDTHSRYTANHVGTQLELQVHRQTIRYSIRYTDSQSDTWAHSRMRW